MVTTLCDVVYCFPPTSTSTVSTFVEFGKFDDLPS